MRSRKTAAVISVLTLALAGFSTTAKSATIEQATHAIHENYNISPISDLEIPQQDEVICLALNQYHEARGSSEADIKAVGYSTRNRVRATESKSFCKSIWEKGQYVWTTRTLLGMLPKEKASWLRMLFFARDIVTLNLEDPTDGADSFYSRRIHAPAWTHRSPIHLAIGAHIYVRMRKNG
jgi:N-acetylmuramoyl-L-alanine amidase